MNTEIDKTNQIVELIQDAGLIAIVPSKIAGVDAFAAAVGLYHMLKGENKSVTIIYPGALPEEFKDLQDVDITSNVGDRELLISVDYSGTEASKVHYSTQDNILYLTVSPVDKGFDFSKIKSSLKGFSFDTIITIGAQVPEDLGQTYNELNDVFAEADILNLDNTDMNHRFGTVNLVDSTESSLSLLVLNKAMRWGLKLSNKAAEALLKGITSRKGI